jgi:imidazolonepropionase
MKICYKNFNQIISLAEAFKKDGRSLKPADLSIIENASIVFDDKEVLWLGHTDDLPAKFHKIKSKDMAGHILTPELVDSHTHLVFGGNRSFEYTLRLNGADYEEIASAGGGILATMEKTITATEEELFKLGVERVERIKSYGVGTIEIKSGYGLTSESERKICHVIHRLKKHFFGKVQIFNTFMAAHAVPKSFDSSSEYINTIVIPLLEELHRDDLIDFVDIFQEEGYFSLDDTKVLFEKAKSLGLNVKIHADEFNDNGGAKVATNYKALSADHLLCTSHEGILALAKSDTVATLLPGTAYFLGKPLAIAREFLDAGCKVALASDYNPGSCHCDNLLLIASISAKSLGMNIAELWAALCLNSAHALGLKNQGAIITGMSPRFSIFKCESVDEITYSWGRNFSV